MIDRKLFQKTFSTLHASPDTLSEVYKVVHKEQKHRHPFSKGMLVAAALAMCITVAAAAALRKDGVITVEDYRADGLYMELTADVSLIDRYQDYCV